MKSFCLLKSVRAMFFIVPSMMCCSCEPFLDVKAPNSKISSENVFLDEGTAKSALRGLYQSLYTGLASGSTNSISVIAGLSADELNYVNFTGSGSPYDEIAENDIAHDNSVIASIWSNSYSVIYGANLIMEKVAVASNITEETSNQIVGEALFLRAFIYFYLTNLFGDVPLVTGTNYNENATLSTSPSARVYDQIVTDLHYAKELLEVGHLDVDRVRPNRLAVVALLARVELYQENWALAASWADELIDSQTIFRMAPIDNVFVKEGGEAIWQRLPPAPHSNTGEAALFLSSAQTDFSLTESLSIAFEVEDLRHANWITAVGEEGGQVRPYKYKATTELGGEATEYSIILRLAEQYLIRAEARTRLGLLGEALLDVDIVRARAGLPSLNSITPEIGADSLLDSIMAERQRELFTEWGHRWLDLKRTGKAESVLGLLKPGFTLADALYPIPESERLRNPNLN